MSELASEPWDEIERQYTDGTRVNVLAGRFNVSRDRIRRRASKFGWVRNGADDGDAAAPVRRPDGRSGSLNVSSAGDGWISDQFTSLVERHRAAWAEVYGLRDDAHRILKGEQPKGITDVAVTDVQERLSLAVKVMALFEKEVRALTVVQEGERRAYGLGSKQHQEPSGEGEAHIRQRCELIDSILSSMHHARFEPANTPDGTEPAP